MSVEKDVCYDILQVSKCSFHKYGVSGTIEVHDALCVLPLNIINEKVNILIHTFESFLLISLSDRSTKN